MKLFITSFFMLFSLAVNANENSKHADSLRIISMSPHLTELVYALELGDKLVGVSDHSDFPDAANTLPRVVSYQGANLAAILRLRPSHVLAWHGGNKTSDIEKIKNSGVSVYASSVENLDSLKTEIVHIADFLNVNMRGKALSESLQNHIVEISNTYRTQSKSVLYFIDPKTPLTLGNDPWLNDLLSLCGLHNLLSESIAAFPKVNSQQIMRLKPDALIIANNNMNKLTTTAWLSQAKQGNRPIVLANPDKLHRFTMRSVDEMRQVCKKVHTQM